MAYNIVELNGIAPTTDLNSWISKYSDVHMEYSHDQSMLTLATPDDALLVVGPPRFIQLDGTNLTVVGFLHNINYNETAQVQPMKAIGSRRHLFSRTNAPVQGTIMRMMILGKNLAKVLYSQTDLSEFSNSVSKWGSQDSESASMWYSNLEEDIFRIPFGLGVIYSSPANRIDVGEGTIIGAEYIEACTLISKQSSIQAGQAMIMENVSFMADRVMPWTTEYNTGLLADTSNPLA